MADINFKLEKFAQDNYNESERDFANKLRVEAQNYKLGDDVNAVGFLLVADIEKSEIRNRVEEEFGSEILEKLQLMKRISKVSIPETNKRIHDLRKIFIEITNDLRLIILKIIERLVTLKIAAPQSLSAVGIAEECLYLYSPIAHRLGISKLYQPMEDLSFKYIYPDDYKKIHKAIELRRESLERKLKTMSHSVGEYLKKQSIPAIIKHRVKRPYSIYRKLKNQNTNLDGIHDLMALRVITQSEEHCYLTLGIIHSKWIPIEKRFRDWITYPKPNGYRSIQTTVHTTTGDKFEIQVRTEQMDIEAEYGSSAHWAYKENNKGKDELWTKKLKEFLDNDEYFENPIELFELLKNEMKSDFIHVLTPKGNIVSLVEKATPIDFAFAVHTDLGYKVIGARVNGKFAKLKTELKSGDVVEVISSNSAKPSRDWLDFVKSTRSRSKILRWFKNNERDLMISDGRKSWERLKKQYKSKLNGFDDEAIFKSAISKMGYAAAEDFFWQIANGNIKCTLTLLKKIFPKAFEKTKNDIERNAAVIKLKKLGPQITVEGLKGIETRIAKCCHPIKGEPIVGYVTRKSEIKIHRVDCHYISPDLIDQTNIKSAEWSSGNSLQNVKIKIFGPDFTKMLAAFANEAADYSLPVLQTEMQSVGKKGLCLNVEVQVQDIEQLHKFTSKLKTFKEIEAVKIV